MKITYLSTFIIAGALLTSCSKKTVTLKSAAYHDLYQETPRAILVMLPINKTNEVEAKELFYSTLTSTLADQGYYVLPPFISQEILRHESANDAERFVESPLKLFGSAFGADAVLFTTIYKWKKNLLTNKIQTQVEYILKSTKTNKVLFQRKGDLIYNTSVSSSSGNLVVMAIGIVASKVLAATTSNTEVSRMCNWATLSDMPTGRYHIDHLIDSVKTAGKKEFKRTVK